MAVQQTSIVNVEATVNASFNAAVAAFALPSWLTVRPSIAWNWDDIPLTTPCYGIAHIPVVTTDSYQGRQVGGGLRGMRGSAVFEASAFVTKTGNPSWAIQLRTMYDWVLSWAISNPVLVVKDYAAALSAPANTAYKIDLRDVAATPSQEDTANP
jgi:hypothetical protein